LGRGGQRLEPVASTECREISPVVRVGPFGRRGKVRPGLIVLDGSRELGEDPCVFPRDRAVRRSGK